VRDKELAEPNGAYSLRLLDCCDATAGLDWPTLVVVFINPSTSKKSLQLG